MNVRPGCLGPTLKLDRPSGAMILLVEFSILRGGLKGLMNSK